MASDLEFTGLTSFDCENPQTRCSVVKTNIWWKVGLILKTQSFASIPLTRIDAQTDRPAVDMQGITGHLILMSHLLAAWHHGLSLIEGHVDVLQDSARSITALPIRLTILQSHRINQSMLPLLGDIYQYCTFEYIFQMAGFDSIWIVLIHTKCP